MIIAENGPLLHHAGKILYRAMERYWKEHSVNGKWHFIRNTEDIRTYTGDSSNVVGKLFDWQSKYETACKGGGRIFKIFRDLRN